MAVQRRAVVQAAGAAPASGYFTSAKSLPFVPSGAALLDCVLGGGYVLGRIVNLVGDKSSGKTLLAIEGCANFARDYPNGYIRYCEAEAAFDIGYADALGLPTDRVVFAEEVGTVEALFDDLEKTLDTNPDRPGLYIIDSLDALSDKAESERKIDEGSFGAAKAKKLSELFRRLTKKIEASRMLVIVISQIRDKIGVTFGETKGRTGGHALDFYASQVLWLAEVQKIAKEREGVKRIIGIQVKATCKKNKVGLPFRDCEFPVLFGYGIDDLEASATWLKTIGHLEEAGLKETRYKSDIARARDSGEVTELRKNLTKSVVAHWARIETSFLPKRSKY